MSFLDAASFSKSWSFLPIDFGALNNDPYRSRNTISNAQNAYIRGLYKDSRHIQNLGEGSVFKVTLRQAIKSCQLYALKTAKLDGRSAHGKKGDTKKSSAGGVFSALKEIQVVSNVVLRSHPNIVNILGWDWSLEQIPVIFVEYAEHGSVRDYLQFNEAAVPASLKRQFARDIACGLNALHAVDIAHGDVKLLNTLVFMNGNKGLIARISDFSHSVFGLSTKRKSTYPGSSRYNAPEIRGRETIILSDQLALCEVFSFGLLVWEILKDARPFFDGLDGGSSITTGTEAKEDCFDYLGLDGLLQKALSFLPFAGLPRDDTSMFYHMFQITLRDRAEARSDMQVVAMALDPWDEGRILPFTPGIAVQSILVWEFNPWDYIPWEAKTKFIFEIQEILEQPIQPNHAELHFILSRCYSEGYGVVRNMNTAIEHLYMAAQFDNIEATCMIELYDVLLSYYSSGDLPSLASSEVSQVIKRMKNRCMSAHTSTADELGGIEPAKHMREWVRVNGDFIRRQPFFWHDGSRDRSYSWDSSGVTRLLEDISDYGQPICDVTVSYGSLLSSLNSGTFYEVAAANGLPALWKALEHMETLGGYEDSSWGDYNEVWSRLVNSAASNGQLRLLRQLIEEGSRQNVIHSSATGETPLHFLPILQETSHGLCTMIEDLVSLGISVDAPRTTRTWLPPFGTELYGTPLHVAVRARCLQSVKVLLMMGADPTVSFADNPSPLLLACALHLAEIVACLAKSKKVSPKDINEGLCALGFPTRKGWFERLIDSPSSLRKSSPTPYMLLLWRCMQTAVALTGQDDLSESPFLVKDDQKLAEGLAESARAFQYEFRQRRWELDGEPLIQAIRHGQRDPEAIYALLEMAMVPFSDHGRYGLLAAIVEGPGCKLDDPAALQFLRMVLGDRSSALVSHTNAAWAEWTSGWPAFFLTYRVPSSKIPVFHDWVYEGLIDAVRILIGLMKDLIPRLVQLRDHNNNTALDRAIDSGSKDMYLLLRPYGDTTIDQDLERARQKGPNRLLPTLVGIELDEQEREHLRNLVLLTGNHTLDDELKDIADSLETYGDWFLAVSGRAMMQVQSHLRARDSIRAQRARRMLMTCVRLRMHFQGVQNTELAKNEVVDAVVPTALRVMYDDDFTQLMPEWLLNRVMLGYDVSTEHGRRRNLANKEPFGQTIRRELEKAFGVRQHDGFTTSDLTELFRWLKGELSQVQKICDEHKSPNLPLQFRRDGQ